MAKGGLRSRKTSTSASASAQVPSLPSNDDQDVVVQQKSAKDSRSKKPKTRTAIKKVLKIEQKRPKKPPTAFFYFLEDFRKAYQQINPEVKSMREVGKAGGQKWNTMTYEEKVQYYDIATEKRAQFEREMTAYLRTKEDG